MSINYREEIRERFLLNENTPISDEWIELYISSTRKNNFKEISLLTQGRHNDRFTIWVTHDVDWVDPWHPYSLLKVFTSRPWIKRDQIKNREIFLEKSQGILEVEKEFQVDSIWFSAGSKRTFGRYDIRYESGGEHHLKLLQLIKSYNQTNGLHSSPHGIKKGEIIYEAERLSELTGQPVKFHRSHYLKSLSSTDYISFAQAGIQYDMSLGYARKTGFRNHYPGMLNNNGVYVVPMILMDNAFFYKSETEVLTAFKETLSTLKKHQGSACICFHPENIAIKPGLLQSIREIIKICISEGAIISPIK